jgi:hypothetical protein
MATFAGRTQLERDLPLWGKAARLYASCGRSDDYLELAFPEAPDLVSAIRERLTGVDPWSGDEGLDLRFHDGPPVTVSLLALHLDSEQRALPRTERLTALLLQLAQIVPDLEFGDLLPEHVRPAPALPQPDDGALHEGSKMVDPASVACRPEVSAAPPAETSPNEPIAPKPSPRVDAEDLFLQAMGQARKGHSHKALRLLEELLHDHPTNGPAWKLREEIRLLERREKRRQRDPRSGQAQLEVGFSYLIVERNQEAAKALSAAARLDPVAYLSHLLLGIALHREGERESAREAYQRAARLQPESDGVCADLLESLERGEPPIPLAESSRASHSNPQPQAERHWARAV